MPPLLSPVLILASRSPRRARLLREAGFEIEQQQSPFDDPLTPESTGQTPEQLAVDLARRKAEALWRTLPHDNDDSDRGPQRVVLAADTLAIAPDRRTLLGTPHTRAEAEAMIRSFLHADHEVITGVCLLADRHEPVAFADAARVRLGGVSDEQLTSYLDTGDWSDKAGGYNLVDRQRAGWPITTQGDPTTIVGLPMRRLVEVLQTFGVPRRDGFSPASATV